MHQTDERFPFSHISRIELLRKQMVSCKLSKGSLSGNGRLILLSKLRWQRIFSWYDAFKWRLCVRKVSLSWFGHEIVKNITQIIYWRNYYWFFREIDCNSTVSGACSNSGDGQTSSGVSSCSSDLGDCAASIASSTSIDTMECNMQLSNGLIVSSPSVSFITNVKRQLI